MFGFWGVFWVVWFLCVFCLIRLVMFRFAFVWGCLVGVFDLCLLVGFAFRARLLGLLCIVVGVGGLLCVGLVCYLVYWLSLFA